MHTTNQETILNFAKRTAVLQFSSGVPHALNVRTPLVLRWLLGRKEFDVVTAGYAEFYSTNGIFFCFWEFARKTA